VDAWLGSDDFDWVLGYDDAVVSGWTSVHVLKGPASQGRVESVGKNNHGQFAPENLPPLRALAAGSEHCVAITKDNQVVAWGWGEHGNCGEKIDERGNVSRRWNVISLPDIDGGFGVKSVAAGCATTFVVFGRDVGRGSGDQGSILQARAWFDIQAQSTSPAWEITETQGPSSAGDK
jgi:hypothetical protein